MSDYLQQLERLGQLLSAGVLTDEEFKAEKARILSQHSAETPSGISEAPHWLSRKSAIAVAAISIVVLSGAYGLFAFRGGTADNDAAVEKGGTVKTEQTAQESAALDSLGVRDLAACEGNDALVSVLTRLREAGSSEQSTGKVIAVDPTNALVDVQSSTTKVGSIDVMIAEAAISRQVSGMQLRAISSLAWRGGEGFRLTFNEPVEVVMKALATNGLQLESGRKQLLSAGTYALLTNQGSFASLTCLKSEGDTPAHPVAEDGEEHTDV